MAEFHPSPFTLHPFPFFLHPHPHPHPNRWAATAELYHIGVGIFKLGWVEIWQLAPKGLENVGYEITSWFTMGVPIDKLASGEALDYETFLTTIVAFRIVSSFFTALVLNIDKHREKLGLPSCGLKFTPRFTGPVATTKPAVATSNTSHDNVVQAV